MKKFLVAFCLLLTSLTSLAAGPLDGIYSCNVNLLGSSYPSYVTVNGHADGGTIYAVAAVSQSQYFYGYGIGQATSSSFVGSTMYGYPFNFAANALTGTMSGTISVLWGNSVVKASASCAKIW